MAALAEPFSYQLNPEVRDLRDFRAPELQEVLESEEREWEETLDWDFRKSADLVRKFVDMGNLNGVVLLIAGSIQGYAYYIFEDGKGLVGDLYVVPAFRTAAHETLLINALMDQIAVLGSVPRVEAQIMMVSADLEKPARGWPRYEVFRRSFLGVRLPLAGDMESRPLPPNVHLQQWNTKDQEVAAQLIPVTYKGHIDSRINDQYRSVVGARKFLHNIVQFPGCGVFEPSCSATAFNERNGQLCGMVLSSLVAESAGHITQLCVHPEYQGLGLGRELLRSALGSLHRVGCRSVSLTVTVENRIARMLYERLGFRLLRRFAAYVWEDGLQ